MPAIYGDPVATSGQFAISDINRLVGSIDFDKSEVEGSIAERFARQIDLRGDTFAVRERHEVLSYRALDELSNQLANRLLEDYGSAPLRVGLIFPLTLETIAAHLGIWKAGKTCVPIDPAFPPARAAEILADAGAELAIVADSELESASQANIAARTLGFHSAKADMPEHAPNIATGPDDPAAIIYVPGADGKPEGIVHSNRSLLHRCWSDTQYFQISPHDRVALLASPGHGSGIPQMLSALLNGASLHPFDLQLRGFEELYDWVWTERISIFYPSVSAFRQFLEGCPAGERYDDCRYVVQAGEPTLATTVEAWREHFSPSCTLVCQLVTTETQVISRLSISHDQQIDNRYTPVGYTDCDKQLSIVDTEGNHVQRGSIGELVVSSRYLSPGIWSAQDKEVVAHSGSAAEYRFGDVASVRTNDLVSIDTRGRLLHHGRCDSAIKLRGYRIDFSEIESALTELESIDSAVCVSRELENHRRQIVAFYVPTDLAARPCDGDLRRWLRARIPPYMVPSRFLAVTELPRTINGKIARRAVENLEIVQRSRGLDLQSFENEIQRRFVEIWRAAIGHNDIGIDDDFFDIGGDSLSALQVSAALSRCIGRPVPFSKIAELRNIRRLVEHLDRTGEPITCISLLPGGAARPGRRPLFCIEGLYPYRTLAEAIGPRWQTIGVRARPETHLLRTYSVEGRPSGQPAGNWPPSVEQLAATYISEIRRHQRTGPFNLAGLGFGGVVAFEMARQLSASGESIALLALFDSLAPGALKPLSPRGWLNLATAWVRNSMPITLPDSRSDRKLRERQIAKAQAVALMRYRPTPWQGNAVLFPASVPISLPGLRIADNLGWGRLIGGQLSVHTIAGDRRSMLHGQTAQVVASTLRPYLDTRSR
jgi:acyl-coenzyme A synthetase/AMP-(fatty) acid ligase/thioesterase domain-containing protein/acyl carrier protein